MRQKREEGKLFPVGTFLQPCAGKALMKIMNINLHSPKTDRKCSGALEWMIKEKNKPGGKMTAHRAREATWRGSVELCWGEVQAARTSEAGGSLRGRLPLGL